MIKVTDVRVEEIDNPGCNNGNYPEFIAVFDNGMEIGGTTCRCGNGCSGTCRLPKAGMEFKDLPDFEEWSGFPGQEGGKP